MDTSVQVDLNDFIQKHAEEREEEERDEENQVKVFSSPEESECG